MIYVYVPFISSCFFEEVVSISTLPSAAALSERSLRRSEAPILPFEPGLPTAADAQQQPIWGAGAHRSSSHPGVAWDGLMFDVPKKIT